MRVVSCRDGDDWMAGSSEGRPRAGDRPASDLRVRPGARPVAIDGPADLRPAALLPQRKRKRQRQRAQVESAAPTAAATPGPVGRIASAGTVALLARDGSTISLLDAGGDTVLVSEAGIGGYGFPAWSPRREAPRDDAGRRDRPRDRHHRLDVRRPRRPRQTWSSSRAPRPSRSTCPGGRTRRWCHSSRRKRTASRCASRPSTRARRSTVRAPLHHPQRQPVLLRLDRLGPDCWLSRDGAGGIPRRVRARRRVAGWRARRAGRLPLAGHQRRRRARRVSFGRTYPADRPSLPPLIASRSATATAERSMPVHRAGRDGLRPRRNPARRPIGAGRRLRGRRGVPDGAAHCWNPVPRSRGPCSMGRSSASGGHRTATHRCGAHPERELPVEGRTRRFVSCSSTSRAATSARSRPSTWRRSSSSRCSAYFDQYALSHRLWAPDSSSFLLPVVDADGAPRPRGDARRRGPRWPGWRRRLLEPVASSGGLHAGGWPSATSRRPTSLFKEPHTARPNAAVKALTRPPTAEPIVSDTNNTLARPKNSWLRAGARRPTQREWPACHSGSSDEYPPCHRPPMGHVIPVAARF